MMIQSISQVTSLSRPQYVTLVDILCDNFAYYLKLRQEKLEVWCASNFFKISHRLAARPLRYFFSITTTLPKELLSIQKGRYLIIANHRERIDPYLIFATLPYEVFAMLLPVRMFTANIYFTYLWQRVVFTMAGCFRAYSVEGKPSGLKAGLSFSDKKQSLFIFPQGKRVQSDSGTEVKIGAAYLALKRNFTLLPVHISYNASGTRIVWGKPFTLASFRHKDNLQLLSQDIFKKVLKLSEAKYGR